MINHISEDVSARESKIRQRSLLIRVIGLLLLALPVVIVIFYWNMTLLLLFVLLAGVITFVAAYRLSC